jgi:hypothetical protein
VFAYQDTEMPSVNEPGMAALILKRNQILRQSHGQEVALHKRFLSDTESTPASPR